jgi:hypothetical protein
MINIFESTFVLNAISILEFFSRARKVRDFDSFWYFYTNLPLWPQIGVTIAIIGVIGLCLTLLFGALSDNHKCDF